MRGLWVCQEGSCLRVVTSSRTCARGRGEVRAVREMRRDSGSLCWSCGGVSEVEVKMACALLEALERLDQATARAGYLHLSAVKAASPSANESLAHCCVAASCPYLRLATTSAGGSALLRGLSASRRVFVTPCRYVNMSMFGGVVSVVKGTWQAMTTEPVKTGVHASVHRAACFPSRCAREPASNITHSSHSAVVESILVDDGYTLWRLTNLSTPPRLGYLCF